ncbi:MULTISPECIES: hypothetical protein [Fusobacterium]|jgi:Zn-dependent M16 (insulinase) family peptidase|uniref:Uncharacterized protein n=1 Tax=Fusobacterium varium ATCC 27725 TaxID=469618 RepID=A0ABM6U3F3_FUSVA|nr:MULTISPECIES: hypothetical protein [Fusobacterium]AVQ30809.1 hypothetical protein C4N18_06130 [Fusobacterium varium ATCC 27725]EGR54219.1 hypothetical protein FVAG_03093 [Fusobacterium varium ATCC 27725]MCF2672188.1 hypothetical protein [Fusobacterium varium]MCI6033211.1 hypothetical protein [Fusobacterium varium]MDY3058973.1 hypothetical protein [Fusobacterium sp.]
MKKVDKEVEKTYRLFGCRFIEEDFKYINKKLKKLKKKQDMSNSVILLELFKIYSKENKK